MEEVVVEEVVVLVLVLRVEVREVGRSEFSL